MVTHIPPPSPSLTASSLSNGSSGTARPSLGRPRLSRDAFPPSPPSSYTYAETIAPYAPSNVSASAQRRRSSSGSRAPSVASTSAARHTSHRSHRRNRRGSELDAAPELPSNAFPWFAQSGDVEICLKDRSGRRRGKRYLLHSLILTQNSKWFAEQFGDSIRHPTERPSSNSGSRRGSVDSTADQRRIRKYELSWSGQEDSDPDTFVPMLVPSEEIRPHMTHTHERSRPPTSSMSFFHGFSSRRPSAASHASASDDMQRDLDIIDAYDNMFLSFYNHAPHFDTLNVASAYVECKVLLQVATQYSALEVVGPRCDHHLLRFQSKLWKQVAKYPTSYLKLAHQARSKAIFTEAFVHVVGQWPNGRKQLGRGAPEGFDKVIDLIEDKVEELEETRARIEAKLFRITLTTSRGDRVGPLNSWMDWLAMSLFRQWVADNTSPAHSGILKDSSSDRRSSISSPSPVGQTYRLLAAGGEAYLSHEELKKFMKKGPAEYSRDGLRKFERRVDELKNLAKDAVKPLTRSFLELDAEGHELPYLTCTRLEEGDVRWLWRD